MSVFAVTLAMALSAPPNVVLISVDTLRADHLGFYGHTVPTSPHLDALAAKSLVFDDMICEVPLTGPSFCAIHTSRYPRSTGVTRNGLSLPEDVPTLAGLFHEAGYETICVTSNWTLKADLCALDRGFDVYDDHFKRKRWIFIKSERGAKEVSRLALHYLDERDPTKPFFAWVHYSDPHAPYKLHDGYHVANAADYEGDPGADEKMRYDSEIAFTDAQIQRLLDALPRENTFVVFLADHGESLKEHDYVGHGRHLYQTGLHVPFMIYGPGISPGRTAEQARGLDVAPTLLGLAGITPDAGMAGLNLLAGDPDPKRLRVVETYGGAVINLPGAKEIMANAGPEYQAVLDDGWKFILDDGSEEGELYYLPHDPKELHNAAEAEPERAAALAKVIREWSETIDSGTSEGAALKQEDIEALRSLGYVE